MRFLLTLLLMLPAASHALTASDVDFDRSGHVDFPDFLEFATDFGTTNPTHDHNGSGTVDFDDFVMFVEWYGKPTEWLPLTFPDPAFEEAVRFHIDKPTGNILAADVSTVYAFSHAATSLQPDNEPIQNIEGIQHLTTLQEVSLFGNQISDLSPLVPLKDGMFVLILGANQISDISVLLDFPVLQHVMLLGNPLSEEAISVHIPMLQDRGVSVVYQIAGQ
jgi:hypothetical protein